MIDEELLSAIEEREEEHPALARLIDMGRKKGYVTIDDILTFFPEAEQDVDQLEEAFAALISAGVAYVDEPSMGGPTDEDLVDEEEAEEEAQKELSSDDNYLANIDTDDTIGLYSKRSVVCPCSPRWKK
jgi:RNA polymerase primary sigma factor